MHPLLYVLIFLLQDWQGDYAEVLEFEDGVVASCEAKSCYDCHDNKDKNYTIESNHTSASDCEDYTVPYSLGFDFGIIREYSDPTNTVLSSQPDEASVRRGMFVGTFLVFILTAWLCHA